MGADDEIAIFLQPKPAQHIRTRDFRLVIRQHFRHRATDLKGAVRGQAFAQKIFAGDAAVGHIHIADMVDDLPVNFFGHALIVTPVAGFQMENRDF